MGRRGWVITGQGQKAESLYAKNQHVVFFAWGRWAATGALKLNPYRVGM